MGRVISEQEFFSEPVQTMTEESSSGKIVSPEEFFGESEQPKSAVPSIPDEHKSSFISALGDALYNQSLNVALRASGALVGGIATTADLVTNFLPLNPLSGNVSDQDIVQSEYRKAFVEPGKAMAEATQRAAPATNTFESILYGFADSLGALPPVLLGEVMAGQAIQRTIAGQIAPNIEAIVSKIPDFVLGTGWRNLVEGFRETGDLMGSLGRAGESMAWGMAMAKTGLSKEQGLTIQKAILSGHKRMAQDIVGTANRWMVGKMASLGLAQSFYNASKEGRLPTADEMIASSMNAGIMGFLFAAIPQFAEATKVAEGRAALVGYGKKIENLLHANQTNLVVAARVGEKIYKGKPENIHAQIWQIPEEDLGQAEMGFLHPKTGEFMTRQEATEYKRIEPEKLQQVLVDMSQDLKVPKPVRQAISETALQVLRSRGKIQPPELQYGYWKDSSWVSKLTQTMERTLEQMGQNKSDVSQVQEYFTEKVKENETFGSDWLRQWVDWIHQRPMRELGVKPRSEQDKILFDFAEGKADLATLQKAFPNNWELAQKIVEDGRSRYGQALLDWNATRYEYNLDPVPRRQDYVRHMRELRTATDMLGWFFSDKTPTEVAALVQARRQGRPMSSAEMQREGEKSERSYILSMQDYGHVVKNARFHLDSVQRGRKLEQIIRAQAEANATAFAAGKIVPQVNLQNFMSQLVQYNNNLAGQPSQLTQAVRDDLLGRPAFAVMRYLQGTPVMNMVSGNVAMLFMNALTAPQLAAYGLYHPESLGKGLTTAFLSSRSLNEPLEIDGVQSSFSIRRLQNVNRIPADWVESMAQHGMIFAQMSDRFMMNAIVASRYWQYKSEGLAPKEAMLKADNDAVRIIGDRSLGQQPLIFNEPVLKWFTALQFEINNQWSNLTHDLPQQYKGDTAKLFGAYVAYAFTANVVNGVLEKALGRRPGFDPMYILATLADSNWFGANPSGTRPFMERLDDARENLFGNTPFSQLIATKGGRFPISAAFPDFDKMKMGWGPAAQEAARVALYLSPLGWGGQVKKTISGGLAWINGYVASKSGKPKRFAVNKNFTNFVKGFLFGPSSFGESVEYWNQPEKARS